MQEAELEASRARFGERHSLTLSAKNNLGITLRAQGHLNEARELLESAFRDGSQILGKKHPNTLTAMSNLALALFEAGDLKRTYALQIKVLKWRRQILGETNQHTLEAMVNLSITCSELDDAVGARELDEVVLEIRRCHLGEDHLETRTALGNLASTINNQAVALRIAGQLDEAKPLQFEAMGLMVTAYGEDSLQAACTYSATGALLRLQGDLAQAQTYFRKALEIRERGLGLDAELTKSVQARLHDVLH